MTQDDPVVSAWLNLPRRIYLDTSVLQTIFEFGEVFFDGVPLILDGHASRMADLPVEIDALHAILDVNTRADFELVVTEAALAEVFDRGKPDYLQWALDVRDGWFIRSEGHVFAPSAHSLQDPKFGMISSKDRALLQEALDSECQAFLTMERRLPTAAPFVEEQTGLKILRPSGYWQLLRRWAAIYY